MHQRGWDWLRLQIRRLQVPNPFLGHNRHMAQQKNG